MCDSPEVEETAFVALDYINNLHRHGYKYALERIEDAKVIPAPIGGEVYLLELDLLQTTCHVLDPTPLANCTVRDKIKMTIEGDCDVAVSKVNGVLAVKAFKCKSKPESREQMCVGCPVLLPLNHTDGLQMVDRSLAMFNKQSNLTTTFALLEVARLTSQVVGGGAKMDAEFVLVEKDCTAAGGCVPLQGPEARLAVCEATSVGQPSALTVKCKIFQAPAPVAPATNDTVGGVLPSPPVAPAPCPATCTTS
ncbi:hypothetical protein ANANG_G00093030 [Anguilla anguilla]|uniref:Cystatin fetuin-A-type domain-containing protein n=1 Tax=Anguilla anguilla TaxID=7936 RepID=A0A9D3MRK9_ANGAN|nr:hypothetical protein ANANG_G00093030 [Anguilla anguilla]